MTSSFKFKQFNIQQERCAMKIGTDGVLLGAWVSIDNEPDSILDIGAGTGIISLQLAQRCQANTIDAIEIDPEAFEQCVENFEASNWGDRLFCFHASVQEFAASFEEEIVEDEFVEKYDLIISNPPFYTDQYISENKSRNTARSTNSLPFHELLSSTSRLLSENGVFALILPKKEEANFIQLASEVGLYPKRICRLRGTATSEIKRSLIEFSSEKRDAILETLTIEISRHHYTKEYIALVKDFYLKM